MTHEPREDDLTSLLNQWQESDAASSPPSSSDEASETDREVAILYERCRRVVRGVKRRATSMRGLDTTDLLHRAWEKTLLSKGGLDPNRRWASRQHFFATLSRATIESIIDEARYRKALKRDGGRTPGSLGDGLDPTRDRRRDRDGAPLDEETRAALRQALDEFAAVDPRACTVVAMRQFWGFSAAEVAASFGITERTVNRDWRAARVWLARRVNRILGLPAEVAGDADGVGDRAS